MSDVNPGQTVAVSGGLILQQELANSRSYALMPDKQWGWKFIINTLPI